MDISSYKAAFMDTLPVELAMEVATGHLPMEDDPKAWRECDKNNLIRLFPFRRWIKYKFRAKPDIASHLASQMYWMLDQVPMMRISLQRISGEEETFEVPQDAAQSY